MLYYVAIHFLRVSIVSYIAHPYGVLPYTKSVVARKIAQSKNLSGVCNCDINYAYSAGLIRGKGHLVPVNPKYLISAV